MAIITCEHCGCNGFESIGGHFYDLVRTYDKGSLHYSACLKCATELDRMIDKFRNEKEIEAIELTDKFLNRK